MKYAVVYESSEGGEMILCDILSPDARNLCPAYPYGEPWDDLGLNDDLLPSSTVIFSENDQIKPFLRDIKGKYPKYFKGKYRVIETMENEENIDD